LEIPRYWGHAGTFILEVKANGQRKVLKYQE
jgi:hypothetical protein